MAFGKDSTEELLEAVAGVDGAAEGTVGVLGDFAADAFFAAVEFAGGQLAGR